MGTTAASLAMAALLAAAPAGAREGRRFAVAPPAPWIEPLGWEASRPAAPDAADGLDHALVDEQLRLSPDGDVERYRHLVWRILTTTGVENGSEVRVSFDPSYERLTFHSVVLHRDGRRLDAFDAAAVKVIQQEEELERRLYDGRLTAVLFLRGVRAGDAVEVAYTIRGANPVFGGRFAHDLPLGWGVPIDRVAVRLLAPEGRPVAARVHGLALEPSTSRRGGFVEQRFERAPVPAVIYEEGVPPGVDEEPWLQLSEWRDWGEVASWAAALQPVPPPGAAMSAELARWRALPEDERVLAAVRFAQDEIRYLGIELGPSSHRPHPPGEVLERRFGDCKDKSFLLVTLLAALGIEAEPALVATEVREGLDRLLPSAIEFDHVVVRVKTQGGWRWVDPTVTLERGPLASRGPLPYRRALPVRAGAGLVALEEPPPRRLRVTSTLTVRAFGAPVSLEVRTRFEGTGATRMRQQLAADPLPELARSWLDFYARVYPEIRADGAPRVTDDEATGALEIVERYLLPAVREGDRLEVRAANVASELEDPPSVIRKQPLALAHPVEVHETIRIALPGRAALDRDRVSVDTDATRLRREVHAEGDKIVAEVSYASSRDRIAAGRVPAFADAVGEMRRAASFTVPLELAGRLRGDAGGPTAGAVARVLAGLATLGAALFGVFWLADGGATRLRSLARRRAFARKLAHGRGDSPQTALAFAASADLDRAVAGARCACGGVLVLAGPLGVVRYDGRELSVVPLACSRCGAARPLYATREG